MSVEDRTKSPHRAVPAGDMDGGIHRQKPVKLLLAMNDANFVPQCSHQEAVMKCSDIQIRIPMSCHYRRKGVTCSSVPPTPMPGPDLAWDSIATKAVTWRTGVVLFQYSAHRQASGLIPSFGRQNAIHGGGAITSSPVLPSTGASAARRF